MTGGGLFNPRHTLDGERNVLGSLMVDVELVPPVATILSTEHFFEPKHQTIFDAILVLHDAGEPVSRASVTQYLMDQGTLAQVGGPPYISGLAADADLPTAVYFAEAVREAAVARDIAAYHAKGLQDAQPGTGVSAAELLAAAQAGLDAVAEERVSSDVEHVNPVFMANLDRIEALANGGGDGTVGVPTGFPSLDRVTSGLHPGQMIIVAARPGVGKSTLGLDFVRAASIQHGLTSLIFSLEMSKQEVTTRLISAECRIPMDKLKKGQLDDTEWQRIGQKMPSITSAPLYIDDTSAITMRDIKTRARRVQQRYGLDLVVIDYLQLMEGAERSNSREQEVAKISRQCKLLAKELDVAVVVMSQLNRKSEARDSKRPAVSDLRESGALEQDADIILLLFREDMVDPDSPRIGEGDIIIGKHRNGACTTIPVAAQLHLSRFVEMETELPEPF